jgi:hypothetical protein
MGKGRVKDGHGFLRERQQHIPLADSEWRRTLLRLSVFSSWLSRQDSLYSVDSL